MTTQYRIDKMDSYIDCVSEYLRRLSYSVSCGKITANDICEVLDGVRDLNRIIAQFNQNAYDTEFLDKLFIEIELKLNKIV